MTESGGEESGQGTPPGGPWIRRLDAWLDSRWWNLFAWILRWNRPRSEDFAWLLVERHARLAGISGGSLLRISAAALILALAPAACFRIWFVTGLILAVWGIGLLFLLCSFPARMSWLMGRNRQAVDIFLTPVHGSDFAGAFRRLYRIGLLLALAFFIPAWVLMVGRAGDARESLNLALRIFATAAAAGWFLVGVGTGSWAGFTIFGGFVLFPVMLWIAASDRVLLGQVVSANPFEIFIAFFAGIGAFFHLFNSRGYAERVLRRTGNG